MTRLVQDWLDGKHPSQGFFLRTVNGGGTILFASREAAGKTQRPVLLLSGANGPSRLDPVADTYVDKSTSKHIM